MLVLGKPIGVGVLSAALKKEALDAAGYQRLVETTTRLNTPGIALAEMAGVHAITDVTGFGLAGHALELARGAGLGVTIEWSKVPLLDGVAGMARDGFVTGASARNWIGYGVEVELDADAAARSRETCSPTRRRRAACWSAAHRPPRPRCWRSFAPRGSTLPR